MKDRNRKRKKLSKLTTKLKPVKLRIPPPPVGHAFKSDKDYDRSKNKEIIKKELDE